MSIKPILFNTEMVQAILSGTKTCTRRLIKGFIPDDAIWGYTTFTPKGHVSCRGTFENGYGEKFFKLPFQPGDVLYVRETWSELKSAGTHRKYIYKASDQYPFGEKGYIVKFRWHPSIYMPKEAARIWLKVTDIRVERLLDITVDGIRNEGLSSMTAAEWGLLWNSNIKEFNLANYDWDANPWVFVIEFEKIDKPEEGTL